ncbi:MAG: hypothetical protein V1722_00160 [Candidatus Micrarchaeota archaeon]
MKRKEEVYLYILEKYKTGKITQDGIANALDISLSTVNNALLPLRKMHAVDVKPRELRVIDQEKIRTYWATIRKLDKDVLYSTCVASGVKEIENSLPSNVIFTAFSGYKFKFDDVPADYSEVYAYCTEEQLAEIKRRFPEKKGAKNLYLLKANDTIASTTSGSIAATNLLFVDLWNASGWYARDFLNALGEKLK